MENKRSKLAAIVALDCFVFWVIWEFCFNGNTWAEWIVRGTIFILFFSVIVAARQCKPRPKYSIPFFVYHLATEVAFMVPIFMTEHYVLGGMLLAMEAMILSMPLKEVQNA